MGKYRENVNNSALEEKNEKVIKTGNGITMVVYVAYGGR
jgi:hypothetical protein